MTNKTCGQPVTTSLLSEIRRSLSSDGCFVWKDYLAFADVELLTAALSRLLKSDAVKKNRRSQRIWALANHGEPFTSMILERRLNSVMSGLLGPTFLVSDFSANVVYPGSEPDRLHIDYPFNVMVGQPVSGLIGIQCVLAVDDFTDRNGATEIVRGSHHGCLPPPPDCTTIPEKCMMSAGSLLLMPASTWHRAGENRSAHDRRALLFSFVEGWVRPMTGPDEYSDEFLRNTSPEVKMLLGVLRRREKIGGMPVIHSQQG